MKLFKLCAIPFFRPRTFTVHLPTLLPAFLPAFLSVLLPAMIPVLLSTIFPPIASATTIHVCPNQQEKPSKAVDCINFRQAQKQVRTLLAQRRENAIAVEAVADTIHILVEPGYYSFPDSGLVFGPEDSGTPSNPVIWQAKPGDVVILAGGLRFQLPQIADIAPGQALPAQRTHPEALGKVVSIDLSRAGIQNPGQHQPSGFGYPYAPAPLEVFINQKPLHPARWPDTGTVAMGKLIRTGSIPAHKDRGNIGGIFKYEDPHHKKWTEVEDLWLNGFWHVGYADASLPFDIDTEKGTLNSKVPHLYGFGGGKSWNRYYAWNIPEELNHSGEFYVNQKTKTLHILPAETDSVLELSSLEKPIVSFINASNMLWKGFSLQNSRGMGIYIEEGENISVDSCHFRNLGQTGITIGKGIRRFYKPDSPEQINYESQIIGSLLQQRAKTPAMDFGGGKNHRISRCVFRETGAGGILLAGGDRRQLKKSGHVVEYCDIAQFNRREISYRAGIILLGVGHTIRNNHIHHSPGTAILLYGNDHFIYRNEINHVLTRGDDQGAFYYGRDPSELGNVLQENYFHDITNPRRISAVYHDDGACGLVTRKNVFVQAGQRTILLGGGSHNLILDNFFVESPIALVSDRRLKTWASALYKPEGRFEQRLNAVDYLEDPWVSRFPWLISYLDGHYALPRNNLAAGNVFVNCEQIHHGNSKNIRQLNNLEKQIVEQDANFSESWRKLLPEAAAIADSAGL